jgi:RNA polymerase sigma-70 factor (ECF subfamily)
VDTEAARQRVPGGSAGPGGADTLAFFRTLFDRELSYVFCSLRRLGVPDRDREDLANEVFFRVFQRLADFDAARPARPWLFAFVVRVAAEHRSRAQARYEELGGGDDVAQHAVAAPSGDGGEARDTNALVAAALDTLDLDKRAVLVLHDLDGHSVPEISVALGIPEGTAYSRLRAAREQFTAAARRTQRRER